MALSLLIGVGVPFLFYGIFGSSEIWNYFTILLVGVLLSFIFSAIAFFIALKNENRIRGFGLAILVWLFFAIIYDGIFLLALALLGDYPLENFAIGVSMFNPIDLSRILILLKLDISALMGYTGAVFQKFLGTAPGLVTSFLVLLTWVGVPLWGIRFVAGRKDF